MPQKRPAANIHIAALYARADEDYWKELEKQFASILVRYPNARIWTATDIELGGEVERRFKEELRKADITLLLFSPDFVSDSIIDMEVRELLTNYSRYSQRGAYTEKERFIMPILINHLYGWDDIYDQHFDIGNLRVFDKLPNTEAERGPIYENIARSLEEYVERINTKALEIALPTWIGFLPSIMYNGGFDRNEATSLFKKYHREINFQLNDELEKICTDFKNGQLDMMWCTIDRLPYVADKLIEWKPRIFYQASWSKGADAILVRSHIKEVADLRGQRVLFPMDSPSQTFLNYVLHEHGLSQDDVEAIPQRQANLDLLSKRFMEDDSIAALVIWSPFVEACLHENQAIRVLLDSSAFPNLIADVLITSQEYINLNREEITELLRGWFDEVDRFLGDSDYEEQAVRVLVEAIIKPLPNIIPSSIRASLEEALAVYFRASLKKVHLCSLADNRTFFGLGQGETVGSGQELYERFLHRQYPHLAHKPELQWEVLTYSGVLDALQKG